MRVQVHLRAEELGNIAQGRWRGKKSSPYAVVSMPADGTGAGSATGAVELGRTEVIDGNLSPRWTEIFILDHDEPQAWTPLKISLYHCRKGLTPNLNLGSDPTMGEVDVEVGEVLRMAGQEKKVELNQGGRLYVHITESVKLNPTRTVGECTTGEFHCHLRGLDLQNIESGILGLGAIDPYFELSKKYSDPNSGVTRWDCVYRSDHIPDIINPYWKEFQLDLERLCHGDLHRELKIDVWDQEDDRNDQWLGTCDVTAAQLMESVTRGGNACREHALRVRNKEEDDIGLIVVLKAEIL